ncbi:nuclear pore complex protein Nup85-like [Ruditapes philippinarum]|uniref:nuclear pore complex protein Nup85-like n=1 Tax=Ruditapes philippinarum TaxID=129788 RepID=UPI00295B016A|nr:nuclear pore complex protein Nup85-like [Ruditapes philippinarum]
MLWVFAVIPNGPSLIRVLFDLRYSSLKMAERERDPYYLELPFTDTQRGLQATWGLGNQLFVFTGKNPLVSKEQNVGGGVAQIHDVRWETDMHGQITRKLVNETHNVFVTLQEQVQEASGKGLKGLKPLLAKASKQYRSVLKACSLDVFNKSNSTRDEQIQAMCEEQLKIFNTTELIWSLCEILWIDVAPGGIVISQLLDWLRWHFTEGENLYSEIQKEEFQEEHHEYWDCIYRLVLQGQLDKVRYLLSKHSSFKTDAFQSIDDVLRKMPLFSQLFRGNSISEFDMKWRHWKDDCERRFESGEFAACDNLVIIARILIGDDSVYTELKDLCETWYHMLVSKMLYQKPTVKSIDLHYYVQSCMDEFRSDGRVSETDSILLSALEFDIHQVIKDCSAVLSGWWFVAHLTDILHHCGQLESHRLEFGSNLREYLLLQYATSLMSHKSLWQVGVDYLDFCPEFGRQYLEHFIEKIPIETEKKANKMLYICEKRNMPEQVKSICKIMGMRCIKNKRLGAALSWFLRSKDVAFATLIAEKFLSEYNEQGYFSNLDLIDNLGPSMLISSRLTFLGKYREYHRLYEEKELYAAGSLLLSLLTSRLAPREFWITLLKDAITLLEAKECIYGSKETFELMHCLEELTKDRQYLSTDIDTDDLSDLKETIDLLNLALTRNLARSIVMEGSIKPS